MQVDFYHLTRDPVQAVAPMIAAKVLDSGGRLLIVEGRADVRDRISRALWEHAPTSFLAHDVAGGAHDDLQPILLCDALLPDAKGAPANGARYIAMTDGVWREASLGFERAFLFFDAESIESARETWRALRGQEGLSSRYWRQDGRKWVQDA